MNKKLRNALYEDVICWIENHPQNYVTCCGIVWKSGFSPEDFHVHFCDDTRHCMQFGMPKYSYEMFSITLSYGKLESVYWRPTYNFGNNVQLRIKNNMLSANNCYKKFNEHLQLYTVWNIYSYFHKQIILKEKSVDWNINDFFLNIPSLSILQLALDDINPNIRDIAEEIIIEI